jgi:hypothetical protein
VVAARGQNAPVDSLESHEATEGNLLTLRFCAVLSLSVASVVPPIPSIYPLPLGELQMQAFIVSIVAGCLFPLLPIIAEAGLTNDVKSETWALTGVVYLAAVALVSRNQAVAILGLFLCTLCAVIYGANQLKDAAHANVVFVRYGAAISACLLVFFLIGYVIERYSRHCTENEPFLEI